MQTRKIKGFPWYTVDEYGNVFNTRTNVRVQQTRRANHMSVMLRKPNNPFQFPSWVHRLVAKAFLRNPRPDLFIEVDHIDGNEYNNHVSNLRWLNRQLNSLNSCALGCSFNKNHKKWRAYLHLNGKKHSLGYCNTFLEAHRKYLTTREIQFNKLYTRLVSDGPPQMDFLP